MNVRALMHVLKENEQFIENVFTKQTPKRLICSKKI